jgi:hypothetical protein
MTTQPDTHPTAPADAEPGPAEVAAVLDERIVTSVDVLYAHITAGTLEAVGRPQRLPGALFPDVDFERAQEIFQLGVMAGYLGGQRASAGRRWEHERLAAARDALAEAGFAAMAERIARVLPAPPPGHPADGEAQPGGARENAR